METDAPGPEGAASPSEPIELSFVELPRVSFVFDVMGLRHVLRRLIRSPVFTGVTVLTLAIGIGANTAIFSVIEGVLLRPLPYLHPEQLIAVDHSAPGVSLKSTG